MGLQRCPLALPDKPFGTESVDLLVFPMRPLLLIAGLAALLAAPTTASCHGCLFDVMDECSSLDASGCPDRATHLAEHAPQLAAEVASDPSGSLCDSVEGLDCP